MMGRSATEFGFMLTEKLKQVSMRGLSRSSKNVVTGLERRVLVARDGWKLRVPAPLIVATADVDQRRFLNSSQLYS